MTLTDDEARAKLSPNCLVCKEPIRAWEMAAYIERCENRGKDPLAAPKGGILCQRCLWCAILEMSDDDTEPTPETDHATE